MARSEILWLESNNYLGQIIKVLGHEPSFECIKRSYINKNDLEDYSLWSPYYHKVQTISTKSKNNLWSLQLIIVANTSTWGGIEPLKLTFPTQVIYKINQVRIQLQL